MFASSSSLVWGHAGKSFVRTGVPPFTARACGLPDIAGARVGTRLPTTAPAAALSINSRRVRILFFMLVPLLSGCDLAKKPFLAGPSQDDVFLPSFGHIVLAQLPQEFAQGHQACADRYCIFSKLYGNRCGRRFRAPPRLHHLTHLFSPTYRRHFRIVREFYGSSSDQRISLPGQPGVRLYLLLPRPYPLPVLNGFSCLTYGDFLTKNRRQWASVNATVSGLSLRNETPDYPRPYSGCGIQPRMA